MKPVYYTHIIRVPIRGVTYYNRYLARCTVMYRNWLFKSQHIHKTYYRGQEKKKEENENLLAQHVRRERVISRTLWDVHKQVAWKKKEKKRRARDAADPPVLPI